MVFPDVAKVLNNFGKLFQTQHEYEKAKEHFERGLYINQKFYHKNHPEIAINMNNLGNVMILINDKKDGQLFLNKAQSIKEKNPMYAFKF